MKVLLPLLATLEEAFGMLRLAIRDGGLGGRRPPTVVLMRLLLQLLTRLFAALNVSLLGRQGVVMVLSILAPATG